MNIKRYAEDFQRESLLGQRCCPLITRKISCTVTGRSVLLVAPMQVNINALSERVGFLTVLFLAGQHWL